LMKIDWKMSTHVRMTHVKSILYQTTHSNAQKVLHIIG